MTLGRLLLRSLFYHWRGNSAVLLGVAVGTAVLTGALIVGDSLRGSLRDMTLEQLGWVDQSLVSARFVRQQLANELNANRVSAAILLQGAASAAPPASSPGRATPSLRRTGHVTILGVDDRFWPDDQDPEGQAYPQSGNQDTFWKSTKPEAVLNAALAAELAVVAGDTIALSLQKVSLIPREILLGRRDASDVADELKLTVRRVIPNRGLARFSLNPSPATPRNAFLPLPLLQAQLHQEGRVNALLVGGGNSELKERLHEHLTFDDWGLMLLSPESRVQALFDKLDRNHNGKLELREWRRRVAESFAQAVDRNHDGILDRSEVSAFYQEHRNYLTLESRQLLLEPTIAHAALSAGRGVRLWPRNIFVYLANTISDGKAEIPYSLVAAMDPPLTHGTFRDDEIILVDWKESPLRARPGDKITLGYFEPVQEGRLQEKTATFRLHSVAPLEGDLNDPDLTPEFPGITDKLDIREWNPPFPYDNKRIQPRDERYWEQYRTTPKAYVTMATAQRLWGSRFGRLTSLRLSPGQEPARDARELPEAAAEFRARLLDRLQPEQGGLVFDAVRQRSLESSAGASDFGGLFLGFSFFLIAASLLLVGLLFRLNLDRRGPEIGLLLAAGYRRGTVRWLWLAEGSLLAVGGGLLGLAGAILYAWLMLDYLRAKWPGNLEESFLRLHATENHGLSLFLGYFAALIVSLLTIIWAVRILSHVSPRALLAGETAEAVPTTSGPRVPRTSLWVFGTALISALGLIALGGFVRNQEMQAITFFTSGACFLTAGLAAAWSWMHGKRHGVVKGHGLPALARLGARNADRHPVRSLLTAGLLAAATFLIVAVQSFYRDPGRDFLDLHAGSGGFALFGEADLPVFQDLNTSKGQDELNLADQAKRALQGVTFYPLRLHAGDDASCLNLYQPRQPRLLGVTHGLIDRGGFQFKSTEARSPDEIANPWLLLEQSWDDAIPVFGEANTVEWMLHKGLGQTLDITNEQGVKKALRFVGLLEDSIFQSELLLSEANFLKLYPRQEGYQAFLIQAAPERSDEVRSSLESALADHGFTVAPTIKRLEAYLAVENTYLSTFQALGGLGLLLGALGLAVVLMRTVWERRGELALLRALGFRSTALGWLMLAENSLLLIFGLGLGTLTALVAVAPHLIGSKGEVPWEKLLGLLAGVLVVGLLAGASAVVATLRAPLLVTLRRE
jgi:ABC-type lipoprotein release transport system permease subunit